MSQFCGPKPTFVIPGLSAQVSQSPSSSGEDCQTEYVIPSLSTQNLQLYFVTLRLCVSPSLSAQIDQPKFVSPSIQPQVCHSKFIGEFFNPTSLAQDCPPRLSVKVYRHKFIRPSLSAQVCLRTFVVPKYFGPRLSAQIGRPKITSLNLSAHILLALICQRMLNKSKSLSFGEMSFQVDRLIFFRITVSSTEIVLFGTAKHKTGECRNFSRYLSQSNWAESYNVSYLRLINSCITPLRYVKVRER